MITSQLMLVFYVVRKFPGKTLEELGNTIYEEFGDREAVHFMMSGRDDNGLLKSRLSEIGCVVMRNERYHYDASISPLAKDSMTAYFLQYQLDAEAEQAKKKLKKKLDGD